MSLLNTSILLILLISPFLLLRVPILGSWLHLQSRKKVTKRRRRRRRGTSLLADEKILVAPYVATVSPTSDVLAVPEDAPEKKHHGNGRTFTNPWASWKNLSDVNMFTILLWRQITGLGKYPDLGRPGVLVKKPRFLPTRRTNQLRASWLGHAACFVEFPSGLRVLFDPIFRERCSLFFSWLGPKRYTKAPCQVEDIPFIDVVVISHNHCDHMDHAAIMEIAARHPNVHFFVPLRVKQWFVSCKIDPAQVTELDWWEDRDMTLVSNAAQTDSDFEQLPQTIAARVGCLPCQHTSAQGIFDKAYTLWASWCIESGGKKVYFGGDTGYRTVPELPDHVNDYGPDHKYPHCPAFRQIGELRGPFDLGLIPIGAYDPRHMMSPTHANPYDSVNILKDTRCERAIGIHWGTWVLTEEDVREPPRLLKKALNFLSLPEKGVFDVCAIGESVEFP